jgi:hypothetical protein
LGRRSDDSEHRLVIHHQRDVDGELAIALDELARTVEWIDHPQFLPTLALGPGGLRRFLRQNRYVGREVFQSLDDDALRLQIGEGQR